MRNINLATTLLVGALAMPVHAQPVATRDRLGNALQYVVPALAASYSVYQHDGEGLKELAYSFALAQGSTELLKHAIRSKRPDGSGLGFPSGHVSAVFVSSAFVHARYGLAPAIPLYGLSVLTAYARTRTHHHFAKDVVGGAAVGIGSALLLTHPLGPRSSVTVQIGPQSALVLVGGSW